MAGIDWTVPRNKTAGITLVVCLLLLSLSAFNPFDAIESYMWQVRAILIVAIAYCIYVLFTPSAIVMLFLGFSAGIPILLIFSSLSLWLGEAGVKKSAVTYFAWAALGYSFKFVWAPLIDKLPIPGLTPWLGRRRAWLLVSQIAVMCAILWMAMTDPAGGISSLTVMAFAAVALGFTSATQDIVIDAYRIEMAPPDEQPMISSTYIAGYRIAMIVAGAGSLYLATHFGSTKETYNYDAWMTTYGIMAIAMLVGVITTFVIREPEEYRPDQFPHAASDYLRFLLVFVIAVVVFIASYLLTSDIAKEAKAALRETLGNRHLASVIISTVRLALGAAMAGLAAFLMVKVGVGNRDMIVDSYVDPIRDFFKRYGMSVALLLLALVGLYRVSDIVMGAVANVFYQEIGYTKPQIASVSKFFGLIMTISGGLAGGFLAVRFGVIKILFLGAVLSAITNVLFILLSQSGVNIPMLALVIAADNLSAGLAGAAFIAFLSSLTNISFTAMQYAIFSSIMTLFPKILSGYSGAMSEAMGYTNFFTMTALLTLPVLLLIYILKDRINDKVVMKT